MASPEVNVDGVLVVNDAAHSGEGSVNGFLLLHQGALFLGQRIFRERAGVGQKVEPVQDEVPHARQVEPAPVPDMRASEVTIEADIPITLGVDPDILRATRVKVWSLPQFYSV